MQNIKSNKNSRINKNVVVLAKNHKINFNSNYTAQLANHKLSASNTYNLIKTLNVCNYNSKKQVLTSHHKIIKNKKKKCYCLSALQVPFNQIKNPTNPKKLANIFNKKHKKHINNPLFHLIQSNTLKPTPVYANYFNNTTNFKPARKRIFICKKTLKSKNPSKYIKQKYKHHKPKVNHNQQFNNSIIKLNSLKKARNKNNKIIYSSKLSCFQPH